MATTDSHDAPTTGKIARFSLALLALMAAASFAFHQLFIVPLQTIGDQIQANATSDATTRFEILYSDINDYLAHQIMVVENVGEPTRYFVLEEGTQEQPSQEVPLSDNQQMALDAD